jgi:acyl-coenzyme A synthetase/AMP-(fatty) acid ligase
VILDHSVNRPEASPAIIADGTYEFSYPQLADHAERLIRTLRSDEINVQDCIALCCPQNIAGAAALVGLIERRQSITLCHPQVESKDIPEFCRYTAHPYIVGNPPKVESVHLLIEDNPTWSRGGSGERAKVFVRTSGTTGRAKLAAHDHVRLHKNAQNVGARLSLHAGDRIALPVPLHHLYGLGAGFLPALFAGASIDLQAGVTLLRYLDRERLIDPTVAFLTPTFALTVANHRRQPRPYRMTVMAGEKLPRETFERYSEQSGCIVQVYGSTELGAMAATSPEDPFEVRASTVGRPLNGVSFRLEEKTGQLLCHHEFGFEAYADHSGQLEPAETWFETKDVAEFDEGGRVKVLGRCDYRVKRDGLLVSLSEIEAALMRLPRVLHTAVVGAGQSGRGTGIVAFCCITSAAPDSDVELRKACLGVLPISQVPDVVRILARLPELESGKVDRARLTELAEEILQSDSLFPELRRGGDNQ